MQVKPLVYALHTQCYVSSVHQQLLLFANCCDFRSHCRIIRMWVLLSLPLNYDDGALQLLRTSFYNSKETFGLRAAHL